MGVYLTPFDLTGLDSMGDGSGYATVDQALRTAGLPSLDSIDGEGEGFEEKLDSRLDMEAFRRMVRDVSPPSSLSVPLVPGAEPHEFPGEQADVWLPIPFAGVIVVHGVQGVYNDELILASAHGIVEQCRAVDAALSFPRDLIPPLSPEGYVLNEWRDQLDDEPPSDERWRQNPDTAFFLALFGAVAEYSITNNEAVGYC